MIVQCKQFWSQFKSLPWERQTLWTAGLLALLPVVASVLSPWDKSPPQQLTSPTREFDTFIPKGFVLVPIEVVNFESLDSILGKFGLVDLFQAGVTERVEQRLIARNVRLLRAPHNPAHFAVLVPEGQVDQILKFGGSFTVVVKPRAAVGSEFVKTRTSRTITYEGG